MNEPITDPHAQVEQRRVELIARSTEKERLLQKRIHDLSQQALQARADADKHARNYQMSKANALRADAIRFEETVRTLKNVELPALRIEAENIRQYRTPEMSALLTSANLKARGSKEDQARNVANTLVSARAAFSAHLAKLATRETLGLAMAVAAAATAANVEIDSLVQALLPKQAA